MPFWKLFYHVIWATKYREPTILPPYEPIIFAAIETKSAELGCVVLAMNVVSDHIHVAVVIPPSMAVSKWVGGVKGASSRAINTSVERDSRFHWQEGYGVMSFNEQLLSQVQQYIKDQKVRHASGKLNENLERMDD
jgi:putative transposase